MTIIRQAVPRDYFTVTFSTVSENSIESEEFSDHGYCDTLGHSIDREEWSWQLRDLLEQFRGYRFEGDGASVPQWITADSGCDIWSDRFLLGLGNSIEENMVASCSIHRPGWITDSSWLRVCRLLGWVQRY